MVEAPEEERHALRGCVGEAPSSFALECAPSLRRCPWAVLKGDETTVVAWWRLWRRTGVWPFACGADDQPAWVVQAFDSLSAEQERLDAIEDDRRRQR